MYPASWPSRLTSAAPPATDELQALLQRANALTLVAAEHRQLLQGRRLGLMSIHPEGEDAQLFEQAARGLGAHVSLIPTPTEQRDANAGQLADIGRMLGRLYDTVECQGLSPEIVKRLAEAGNLPMYSGLSGREHWIFQVAEDWRVSAALAERRRWLIQAVLLATLS